MSPEATLLAVNAAFLAFAYLWVYPGLPNKRIGILLRYDLIISAAALLVAGLLYGGDGLSFSLIFFDAPWWLFTILTFAAMEVPAWEWFRRRHGIDYDDF
ncbi:MAG: hypothetical protein AAGF30_06240 [Pseudomonadota bacterium]